MAARLEIEIVDRSPAPGQQGGTGGNAGTIPPSGAGNMGNGWEPPRPQYERPGAGTDLSGLPRGAGVNLPYAEAYDRRTPYGRDAERDDAAAGNRDAAQLAGALGQGRLAAFLGHRAQQQENEAELDPTKRATGAKALMPKLGQIDAIAGMAADGINAVSGGINAAGSLAAGVARNDPNFAFKAIDNAAAALDKIPIAGQVLSASLNLMVAPVRAATEALGAFVERGRQLSGYNAPLAQATAESEIRDILFDIREANELGTEYARLTTLQSEAWTQIKEALLPIKKWLMEWLANFLESLMPYLKALPGTVELGFGHMHDLGAAWQDLWQGNANVMGNLQQRMLDRMDRVARNTDKKEEGFNTMENFYAVLRSAGGLGGVTPLAADPRLNLPINEVQP